MINNNDIMTFLSYLVAVLQQVFVQNLCMKRNLNAHCYREAEGNSEISYYLVKLNWCYSSLV